MQKTFILIPVILCLSTSVQASVLDINSFDELITSNPSNGDTLNILQNIEATSDINGIFLNLQLEIEGNNHYIDGNNLYGGFVLNEKSSFNNIALNNFQGQIYNKSKYAGAIYNGGDEINISNSSFQGNVVDASAIEFGVGGAVYNHNNGTMDISNCYFENNSTNGASSYGGAVANGYQTGQYTYMTINNSIFKSNYSTGRVVPYGGALFNNGDIEINASRFENNYAQGGDNSFSYGGAIYNRGNMKINNSVISNNNSTTGTDAYAFGGAIYNNSNLEINNTLIKDNYVSSQNAATGGAIFNGSNGVITIKNSLFEGNKIASGIKGRGGAIFNHGITNIEDTLFRNNTERDGNPNDIFNYGENPVINFNGTGNSSILSGIGGTGIINKNGSGILNLGGQNSNYTGDFNFNEGRLNLLAGGSYFSAANTLLNNNVIFNMQNGEINNIDFGNLTLNGQSNILADVNFNNNTMDRINANTVNGNGGIRVGGLEFIGVPRGNNISIPFADAELKDYVSYTPQRIETPLFNYNSNYTPSNGNFNFTNSGFNSSVHIPAVAAQLGGYFTLVDTYRNIFSNLDMVMITPREAFGSYANKNKIASASGSFNFSPFTMPEERNGVWIKPYSIFEKVPLRGGPNVTNIAYGSIIGGESGLKKLSNGWYSLYGGYVSYNGSVQNFDGNHINNNGGLFGLDKVFYKGNFFSAWTANVGANVVNASSKFGDSNFVMLNAGVAEKTGYNFEFLNKKMIFQPSLFLAYCFVNTFDYTTDYNISVNAKPLNALHVEPQIKLIGNFKEYLQPYLSVSMVWNLMDKTRFDMNDVYLPELSIKPFVQYGLGVQKRWGERITGFLEAMIRNGGRNGILLQFGLRISL